MLLIIKRLSQFHKHQCFLELHPDFPNNNFPLLEASCVVLLASRSCFVACGYNWYSAGDPAHGSAGGDDSPVYYRL
ncbi:hypothetical protein, partial [Citrobacter freundii]|uniref:hypothetical protein n=1 Tax=Citrobacter freundii TaxID=546 RepID=UPI001A928A73